MNVKDGSIKAQPEFVPNLVCSGCGAPAAFDIAGAHVCMECYAKNSARCPEFDLDELIARRSPAR